MLDTPFVQPSNRLLESGLADGNCNVVNGTLICGRACCIGLALFIGEDRDQPPVAGVEIEVPLVGVV